MSNSNGTNGSATRTAMAPLEQTLRHRRILLTGATGFLGKVFLSLLLRWHPEIDRIYLLTPAQAFVGQWLTSFKKFPPRQKPASFNLDQVMKQMSEAED